MGNLLPLLLHDHRGLPNLIPFHQSHLVVCLVSFLINLRRIETKEKRKETLRRDEMRNSKEKIDERQRSLVQFRRGGIFLLIEGVFLNLLLY